MMRRRKLLSGLGVGLAGGATVLGTGAFDQVNANRNVTVTTANDSEANLDITGDPNETNTTAGGVVEINLANVNKKAVTTLGNILEFDYNGAKDLTGTSTGDNQLELTIINVGNDAVDFYQSGTTTSVVGNTWTIQDPANLPVAVDMEVDTTGDPTDDPTNLNEITVKAEVTEIA